ncbi:MULTISPECIES: mannitol dehydrogenase family protein [unclassified Janthinobacterium]|uniref:mannitol dehydrogenase family protein n=1 Tax=unclassified Janthinobacterium TaxID=2610881 RepID=UPI00160C14C3|nr:MULTISPECIES: mannitol dehydrogenase family protein [unclassified Janthinobacterium]MBB5369139.1 mannitol 2-dehydrogenase [Janthinobacterium sp. K2C7]MBB5381324.1 mannitol 2-dehydrogenase [Janthinobacterium sp. K2Li3]MBB5387522.1 mannitol 2-dehydrogenase [Janthinobacterium sp. K2E3]
MTALHLNQANLAQLPTAVSGPAYGRDTLVPSIVHIGVGGFYRAHQAVYLDDLLALPGHAQWGYCGVGLLPSDAAMRDAMQSQDGLYTVVERSAAGDVARVIGCVGEYLYAPDDPAAVLEKLAAPATRIVSLTITEGGYYVNQGTGEFDASHPDIVYELAHPQAPRCSFGYLLAALSLRRQRGLAPFTILSCDNLQHNGDVTRTMLLAFAALRDAELAQWLATHCSFPNSMVDRITPATTDEHRALVHDSFGINDAWPVVCEPFRQWVIEDAFPHGRPAWELVGAQMTHDVLPYEKMKLRLLNASHQALCYIGMLLGYTYAHEAMNDAGIRALVRRMMDDEVTPLLDTVQGVDLEQYKATLIERFSNPAVRDQLARIGTEGSARIPKFVLPSVREALAQGRAIKLLGFTVACWFRYLEGHDEQGNALPLNDPYAERLRALALQGGVDAGPLLSLHELFGELGESPVFVAAVTQALASLYGQGARAALEHIVQ